MISRQCNLAVVTRARQRQSFERMHTHCFVKNWEINEPYPVQVGTCRMGSPASRTTVVDHRGRVLGVSGLRVADASIMPFVPSANTNAAAMMIGEKVADMILQDS